jgi:DNA-directed RNA polymerase subunit RPC12/RpoP
MFTLKYALLDDYLELPKNNVVNSCSECGSKIPNSVALCWYCGEILIKDIIRIMKQRKS